MKNIYSILAISLFSISALKAQYTLTDNDINFKKASYNSSMIVADSNNLVLNLSTSLSNNLQETSRMHLLAYGNIAKLGLGLGAKFNTRFKDYYKTTSAEFLIAKGLSLKEKSHLNFGLSFGIDYLGVNDNYFNGFVDQSDEFIQNNPNQNVWFMSGFGASYLWDNKLQIGFSMPELVKTNSDFYPTIFSNVAYKQSFGKTKSIYLQPELFVYTTNIAPTTFEGSASFGFENHVWLKLGGRSNKTMLVGLGGGLSFVEVGYNYNMNFSNYEVLNQMQHNINLCFNLIKGAKDSRNEVYVIAGEEEIVSDEMFPYSISITKVESSIEANYYVAVESFKEEKYALASADEYLKQGQKAFIVREVNTGIFHVCLGFDDDFIEIVNKTLIFKNSFAPEAWIIENK